MVAAFFFYYNYKFSTYKFVDFSKITLYTKSDIFEPKNETYYLLLFSSKMSNLNELIKKIPKDTPILAIDIFQQRKNYKNIIYTTAGINTIIKLIQHLNIYEVPVVVKIKKYNKKLYKQDSPLEVLK
ncbi:hypothetical protein [Caminibacter mediatlanticus]|uniref:Uncharacterized protein n=1 Tax=Caminibacter mediatlanticus TB-2 TaxID=391592 RepID=A0AAI9F2B8_9BACT|nr:hypothetical protein [Caminibacter mediatlanticus]EDM24587.1 hypothetical protein CMTB2_03688 [Caminibacter mediatlanticus TB-2]